MLQSQLFTKTRKDAPKDEVSKNADLLIRAGFIHKEMAGVYAYLPLGIKVLRKIENIIRDEINGIGGQELLMTTLQDPQLWQKTSRWDDNVVDNWFKTKLANGADLGIANTHEEPITQLLTHHVRSYKDFPVYIYQFQTKFRNELRTKSGIMRAREFIMKDLYSFSRTEKEFKEFYEICAKAYERIFERVGLGELTYRTVAAGGSFTVSYTDEFQTISEAGEDIIYIDKKKKLAVNKEVMTDEVMKIYGLKKTELVEAKSIEVGNIFPLGTKYSKALGLNYKDESGNDTPVIMGCYGIGLGRLMGTVVEALSDEKGIVWPASVAPFDIHLVELKSNDEVVSKQASELCKEITKAGFEILHDDRDLRPGEKFADSDLIGIPWRVVVSARTIEQGKVEVKNRKTGVVVMIEPKNLVTFLKSTQS